MMYSKAAHHSWQRLLRSTKSPAKYEVVGIIGHSTPLAESPFRDRYIKRQCRLLSNSQSNWLDGEHNISNVESLKENNDIQETPEEDNNGKLDESAEKKVSTCTPWYLKVDTPIRNTTPLSERQKIPDIPENSPEILEHVLQHISVDLGLDDLSLLDLRRIDPPPALGANLLMIVGTARSEKHLHVSADRLCRWLRSQYKLRPVADGLLGRNELKIKLRRKAKRAKMLGSGSIDDNGDDGIRTDWICVDVGTIKEKLSPEKDDVQPEGFIGFGWETGGVKIVVQMLTEQKREELDLEELWGGILKRSRWETDGAAENNTSKMSKDDRRPRNNPLRAQFPKSRTPSNLGLRHYTSCALSMQRLNNLGRRSHSTISDSSKRLGGLDTSGNVSASPYSSPGTEELLSKDLVMEAIQIALDSGDYRKASRIAKRSCRTIAEFGDDNWRYILLRSLRRKLESLPREEALAILDSDSRDSFVAVFFRTLPTIRSSVDWDYEIWLYGYAQEIGSSFYDRGRLLLRYRELMLSAFVDKEQFFQILYSFLRPHLAVQQDDNASSQQQRYMPDGKQLHFALEVLRDMEARGLDVLTEDMFILFQETLAEYPLPDSLPLFTHRPSFDFLDGSDPTLGFPVIKLNRLQRRLKDLTQKLGMLFSSDALRIRALDAFAVQQDWISFWDVFRMPPRALQFRSPMLYAHMFTKVAQTQNQKACMATLRNWVPEMSIEEPPVPMEGDVSVSIMKCVLVAEPDVQRLASRGDINSEWVRLWRLCISQGTSEY